MSLTAASITTPIPVDSPDDGPIIEIRPRRGWIAVDWRELFQNRELLFFFIWRDVKVRYKQTVLGFAWAVLQPACNTLIFTLFFGRMAGFKSRVAEPYMLWVYVSMLAWTLIAAGITTGGMSLLNSQNLLTKIYFPRLFVPTATVGGALVDMAISFLFFLVIAACYGTNAHLAWTIIFVPVLVIPAIMIALGSAYILSALTVSYRDFRFVIPFLSQFLMYGSFVMIPLPDLRLRWRLIGGLNPVFGIVDAFRSAVFGEPWHWRELGISLVTTTVLFFLGLYYFRRTERRFADIA
ncbi:MAG: ABC transporter permease [Tepidisphaeraceae bacterium]|jgi:lipopolysaccharide transport system permease protein